VGGYIAGSLGMQTAFLIAGALFGTMAVGSRLFITETHTAADRSTTDISSSQNLMASWARVAGYGPPFPPP
jgi:hypothetical protein